MRARIKLRLDGTSTVITVPRPILIHMGWLPGEELIVELLEDNTLHARRFTAADIPPVGGPRMLYDFVDPSKR